MGWSLLAKACMIAYVAFLVLCVAEDLPTWTYALFLPLLVIGICAEYKADKARAAGSRPKT